MADALFREMNTRGIEWLENSRPCENLGFLQMMAMMSRQEIDLVINTAAYVPLPSVDLCKIDPTRTILGNVAFPNMLANGCQQYSIPLMHLSTACLYDESREYTEEDEPTRGWNGYCGTYVGSKLAAESVVRDYPKHYILRLRLPFDEVDHPRNYLSKLASFGKIYNHLNSLTHRGDFASWTLDLWEKRAPFGTYHMVNTYQISASDTVHKLWESGIPLKDFVVVNPEGTTGARLSNAKLVSAIGPVRSVQEAVADAINNWKPK